MLPVNADFATKLVGVFPPIASWLVVAFDGSDFGRSLITTDLRTGRKQRASKARRLSEMAFALPRPTYAEV
jgi:hypothetical protein